MHILSQEGSRIICLLEQKKYDKEKEKSIKIVHNKQFLDMAHSFEEVRQSTGKLSKCAFMTQDLYHMW